MGCLKLHTEEKSTALKVVYKKNQAGLHGFTGGMMNVIGGGKFESGFLPGAVSSLVASSVSGIKSLQIRDAAGKVTGLTPVGKAAMIASGGLSGGLSSVIAGGNF